MVNGPTKNFFRKTSVWKLHKLVSVLCCAPLYFRTISSKADYIKKIICRECKQNAREAARVHAQGFPNKNHYDHKLICRAIARTIETGRVLPNRKKWVVYQELYGLLQKLSKTVPEALRLKETTKCAKFAGDVNIARTSICTVRDKINDTPINSTLGWEIVLWPLS